MCAPSPPGEISHLLSLLGKLISKKWLSCQQSFLSIIFSLNLQLSHFNNTHLLTSSFLSPSAFFSIEACLCYEKERKKEIKIEWIETASRLSYNQPKGIAYRTSTIYLLAIDISATLTATEFLLDTGRFLYHRSLHHDLVYSFGNICSKGAWHYPTDKSPSSEKC